jgi:epoxyqueuosine reductase
MALSLADREWLEERARHAGFDLAGLASVPLPASTEAEQSARVYADWIDAGRAGEMDYLKRADDAGNYIRGEIARAMPWARSVLVCAINYNAEGPRSIDPAEPTQGWIARYAWSGQQDSAQGSDYHDVLLPRLRLVETDLHARFGTDCKTRCYVDTGPLVERGYAARAGVGWIGKNTCVINQQQGSWLLLGVIATSLELEPGTHPLIAADRCGSCTRCIDACPTEALLVPEANGPRQMDASRCIAYLTIEKKGSIAEEFRPLIGRQVFGCDICQDVCPWNLKSPIATSTLLPARNQLINPALEWLASLDGPAFNRIFRGSPLERTRRKRLLRNVAVAMGNSGEARYLPQLDAWASGEDPVLAETASWAANSLRTSAAKNSGTSAENVIPAE